MFYYSSVCVFSAVCTNKSYIVASWAHIVTSLKQLKRLLFNFSHCLKNTNIIVARDLNKASHI